MACIERNDNQTAALAVGLARAFDAADLLQLGTVHYVVSDQRFAKRRKIFRNSAHGDRLVPLVVGSNDIRLADPTVPRYITQRVREQLARARG